ncbi:hypothetical protein [Actinoplanes nipponensis]|uniref:Secreted protein n=1 Tax=Actinoplanes nipponensis TaxID=135950 RepID=A0A919JDX2_9ACTN|nr:hypothetical protein [Actinoplanes nipponensis]GIE47993.1 hypothetical protein Ani05nite_15270 [Actinoplanes nipponensis]
MELHSPPTGARRRRVTMAAAMTAALFAALTGASVGSATPALASTVPVATVVGPNSAFDSTPEKTTIAPCPAGQRVLGGGVRVNQGNDHIIITRQEPVHALDTGLDSFVVTAVEDSVGTTNTWALQAYAVCSPPVAGMVLVAKVGPTDSQGFQGVSASCPANTFVLGAGGRILDGQGHVGLVTQVNGSATFPNGVNAGGIEELGTPDANGRFPGFKGNWSVIAFAVCAPKVLSTDVEVVRVQPAGDETNPKIIAAPCPAGKHVTGGTGWADLPAVVNSVNIDANRTRVQVIDRKHEQLAGNWGGFAMAICWA